MMHKVYLALGSNMGDKENYLISAVKAVSNIVNTRLIDVSNIYETEPVGYTDQDSFLNMAVSIQTALSPLELLDKLQRIEIELKRTREIHWGPRTIDIDMLLYDDTKIEHPRLTIPHPRLYERAFVLIPLRDVFEQDYINNENVNQLIDRANDKNGVKLYKKLTIDNVQLIM